MKKLILLLTMILSLFAFTPKSNAGVVIGYIAGAPGAGAAIGAGVAVATGAGIALSNDDDSRELIFMLVTPTLTVFGTLLDVDAAVTQDELFRGFQQKYPFIDNHEALANLSGLVKVKFATIAAETSDAKSVYVTLSQNEIASALETADISEAQFEQIVSDLQ